MIRPEHQARGVAATLAATTLVAGLVSRSGVLDPGPAKVIGVALWCTLVYWLVVFCRPRLRAPVAGTLAVGIGWAVEALQATGLPGRLAQFAPASRWVLGTTFHWPDLVAYLAGGVAGAGVHQLLRYVGWWPAPPPQ